MIKNVPYFSLFVVILLFCTCSSINSGDFDDDGCPLSFCKKNATLIDCECECKEGYFGNNCDVFNKSFVQTYLDDGVSPFTLLSSNIPIDSIYGKEFQSGYIFSLNAVTKTIKVTTLEDASEKLNWPEAITFSDNYEINNYNDWYLPNLSELQDIRNILYAKLKIKGFQDEYYWSSETSDTEPNDAMAIFFFNGNIGPIEKARVNPVSYNYVRAVRIIQE